MAVQLMNKSLFHSFQSDAMVHPAAHSQIPIIVVLNFFVCETEKLNKTIQ